MYIDVQEFITNACVVKNSSVTVDVVHDTGILSQGEVHNYKYNISYCKNNDVENNNIHRKSSFKLSVY